MSERILAIITARGGSKRIPRKNIRSFLGQPIIKYSIDAAARAGCFEEIMVSTEDKEIAQIASNFGANIPFFRSAQTASDVATTAAVIEEVLLEYKKLGKEFDYFCCLYPTAPFVTAAKLTEALELLKTNQADSVFPVTNFNPPIQRALEIKDRFITMIWPENINIRSQDLTPTYHDAGQFYFMKTNSFLQQKTLYAQQSLPIIVSEMTVQDIDNETDWRIAELKYKMLYNIL